MKWTKEEENKKEQCWTALWAKPSAAPAERTDGIRIGTVDDLMLIGLDDLEPSDLSRGSQAARWVVGNHPRHGIRVGTVTATVKIAGSSVRFVLSGMIELGENDRLGAAAVLNAVDEGATEFVIGHGCCC